MMCDFLGEADGRRPNPEGRRPTDDKEGTTTQIGDAIAARLLSRGACDAHHPDREDLDERRARPVGRRARSTSSRTRCTTAPVSSRASARTRPTRGPAVFRLTEHIERLFDSAKIMMMEIPYTVDEHRAGDEGHRAVDGSAVVLHPADRVLRLRRDGPQHAAVHGRRRDRVLAVGRVPRRRRRVQGRAHEDLVLDAPRPQHDAAAVEDDRQLRELVAREGRGAEGRLRRGDHAQPRRSRVGVHRREHLRGAPRRADHAADRRPARCRASRRTR